VNFPPIKIRTRRDPLERKYLSPGRLLPGVCLGASAHLQFRQKQKFPKMIASAAEVSAFDAAGKFHFFFYGFGFQLGTLRCTLHYYYCYSTQNIFNETGRVAAPLLAQIAVYSAASASSRK